MLCLATLAIAQEPAPTPEASISAPMIDESVPLPDSLAIHQESDVTTGTLAFLNELEASYKDLKTLHVKFVQKRSDRFLRGDIESEGELWFDNPRFFRCDYADPEPVTNLLVEDHFYIYVPELEQAEMWRFHNENERRQVLDQLLIGFGAETERLISQYQIHTSTDEPTFAEKLSGMDGDVQTQVLLYAEPYPEAAESCPFVELNVIFDRATMRPVRIRYEDLSESTIELSIADVETDTVFAPELFDTRKLFATGTEIIDKTEE